MELDLFSPIDIISVTVCELAVEGLGELIGSADEMASASIAKAITKGIMGDKPHVRHIALLALFALNIRSAMAWSTDGVCVSRFSSLSPPSLIG